MTTSCGKLLCAPVVVGKRFSFAGRNLCALRKARRAPLHPIGEYALLSPHAPTADCRERTALSKRLTRSRELSAQNALVWVRGFRVFRLISRERARQVIFVFCLHRFTHPLQRYDCQHVWCEGFLFFPSRSASHPLPLRFAQKVCFSAGLFSKARKYRPETADGEGKNQKPSPQTNSTSTDCAQWVKE